MNATEPTTTEMDRLNKMTAELHDMTNSGREYPGAHAAVCEAYGLDFHMAARLTEEYDADQACQDFDVEE